jgi:hypothetical protein
VGPRPIQELGWVGGWGRMGNLGLLGLRICSLGGEKTVGRDRVLVR